MSMLPNSSMKSPVNDGVEGTFFLRWNGLKGDEQLDRVVAPGEGESVEDRRQPGIEIIGQFAPGVSDEFGRLETGRRGRNGDGSDLAMGGGGMWEMAWRW